MPLPTVLFYDPAFAPWASKLRQTCAVQKLRLRRVTDGQLDCSLTVLLSGETPPAETASPLPEPMLILCGLTNAQLDHLLPALRKLGAGPCLKAVLTPTNASWPLRALYEELCKEREQFRPSSDPCPPKGPWTAPPGNSPPFCS